MSYLMPDSGILEHTELSQASQAMQQLYALTCNSSKFHHSNLAISMRHASMTHRTYGLHFTI